MSFKLFLVHGSHHCTPGGLCYLASQGLQSSVLVASH